MDQEIVRFGKFAVIDRGSPLDRYGRLITRGKRFGVIERDTRGPILREGPFIEYEQAREAAERLDREASPDFSPTFWWSGLRSE
jgi:hypothetical protein